MKKLIRITTIPFSLEKLIGNQLAFMSQHYEVIAVSSNEEELLAYGKKQGIRTKTIHFTREITPYKDLKALWHLYRFLKKERPHIVHTHTPKAGLIGMLASYLARVPHRLHTVGGLPLMETNGSKRRMLKRMEKLTYHLATRIYPNSFELRQFIVDHQFCPENKLKVLGNGSSNGVDTVFFNKENTPVKNIPFLTHTEFVFCFIGRIVRDKGIVELVNAFVNVQRQFPRTKLLLVGFYEKNLDPLDIETENLILKHPDIIFTGYQEDVRSYLAASDVLVLPSYREGFPNVVLQAGAMDLPCIVSDINGCNEIIQNGVNGLIVPVKNMEKLQEAMVNSVQNTKKLKLMGGNARKIIKEKYEQQMIWNDLLKEYQKLN